MKISAIDENGGRLPAERAWSRAWNPLTLSATCASCRSRVPTQAGDRKGGVFFCEECLDRVHPEFPEFYDDLGVGD